MIRAGVAAVAASVALAACAGHGMVPSASGSGPSATGDLASPLKASNPCTSVPQQGWKFGGSCGFVVLTAAGGSSSLKTYNGISVKSTLSSGAKAGTVFIFRDATTPGKDITPISPNKVKFPPFTVGGEHPFLYVEGINTGKTITFTKTPLIQITNAKAYPGKKCVLGELASTGKWTAEPLPSSLTGKVLTFPSIPLAQKVPGPGAFFLGFACK